MSLIKSELYNFINASTVSGESTYDIWKFLNPDGTEQEFIEAIRGKSALEFWLELECNQGKTEDDFYNWLGTDNSELIAKEISDREAAILQVLIDAKAYADEKLAEETAARESADNQVLIDSKEYVDQMILMEKIERETSITDTLIEAKSYTDSEITTIKEYTDTQIATEKSERETAITTLETTVTEKITQAVEGSVKDWNQNDETHPEYIKNRPFYKNDNTVLVETQDVQLTYADSTATGVVNNVANYQEFVAGEEYTVVYGGETYTVTATTDGSISFEPEAGSGNYVTITSSDNAYQIEDYTDRGTVSVSIESVGDVKTIEDEYIPDSIARTEYVENLIYDQVKSNYDLWLEMGYEGTPEDFIKYLRGDSAYEVWLNIEGNEGKTVEEYIQAMKVASSNYDFWLSLGYEGTPNDFLKFISGKSAYELWLEKEGNEGKSFEEFLGDIDITPQLDEFKEYVDGKLSTVSTVKDWNQNDETHPDYITNRPFYKVKDSYTTEGMVTVVEETIIPIEDTSAFPTEYYIELAIEKDKTYIVTWNGVEYTCVGKFYEDYNLYYLGNAKIAGVDENSDTGEPFGIVYFEGDTLTFADTVGNHTIKIEEVKTVVVPDEVVKLDQKFIHNADWNQNDIYGDGYIKNRTHWKEETIVELLPETTYDTTNSSYVSNVGVELVLGETYIVTCNGVEYKCVAIESSGAIVIGNAAVANMGDDTGEPFVYVYISGDDGIQNLFTQNAGINTFSISGYSCTYHKIDENYLPDLIFGIQLNGTDLVIDESKKVNVQTIGRVGNVETAEIFNNYDTNVYKKNTASGNYSHAEGYHTTASGDNSHAEGSETKATGKHSHAEGLSTTASGNMSHAEGQETEATESWSHAEGYTTKAYGQSSHAEGFNTTAYGNMSHAEGNTTKASGAVSHAEGENTEATGNGSHAEGSHTSASSNYQHVQGKYNLNDNKGKYAHIVGNGTSSARSNAHTVDWEGNAWFAGDVYTGGTSQDDTNAKKLATEEFVTTQLAASSGSVKYGETQDLTDTEKETARTNIGIGKTSDVEVNSVQINYLTMKDKVTGFDYFITIENGVIVYSSKLLSIEITKAPDVMEYYEGDTLDGMVITATYEDGSTKVITDYTYDLIAGNTSVEISYTENGVTCITTLDGLTIKSIADLLVDFTYTTNADGTYTITGWKGTYNGVTSTELHVPNNSKIIL